MTLKEIKDYDYTPDTMDLTTFFNVEEKTAKNGSVERFFNLNDGVVIDGVDDLVDGSYTRYKCSNGDNLRFISYRVYGSIHYWWLIAKINGIYDAFEELEAGRVLKLLSKEYMNRLVNEIHGN